MLSPWFVTGFAEGEAAFTYSRQGKSLSLYFAIKLTATEEPLLRQIQDFFKVGRIYFVKPRLPGFRSGDTKEGRYYRVTRLDELEAIIEHFDRYPLQGKKAQAYQIWREMVILKRQFRKPDLDKLNILSYRLSALYDKNTKLRRRYNG